MILWTIQPVSMYEKLLKDGYIVCDDKDRNCMTKDLCFKNAYDWLAEKMKEKIGAPPENVRYPIWAWHTRNGVHKKPDLRETGYKKRGEKCVLLEIDIPDDQVVLTDFNGWHYVLNKWYYDDSSCEEEWDKVHEWYDNLPFKERDKVMKQSWIKVFDTEKREGKWNSNGLYVQATFWMLKADQIKKAQFFTAR